MRNKIKLSELKVNTFVIIYEIAGLGTIFI